jgi:hypothetical protein
MRAKRAEGGGPRDLLFPSRVTDQSSATDAVYLPQSCFRLSAERPSYFSRRAPRRKTALIPFHTRNFSSVPPTRRSGSRPPAAKPASEALPSFSPDTTDGSTRSTLTTKTSHTPPRFFWAIASFGATSSPATARPCSPTQSCVAWRRRTQPLIRTNVRSAQTRMATPIPRRTLRPSSISSTSSDRTSHMSIIST